MDDFQHRLLVALERLAGRGEGAPPLGEQLSALIAVLREIRDRLEVLQRSVDR